MHLSVQCIEYMFCSSGSLETCAKKQARVQFQEHCEGLLWQSTVVLVEAQVSG